MIWARCTRSRRSILLAEGGTGWLHGRGHQDGACTLWLFPLQRSVLTTAIPVSVGCALLSSLALIWSTGRFCVGVGRDVQTPF